MVHRPAPLIRSRITACSQGFAVPMWRNGCFLELRILSRLSRAQCCWEHSSLLSILRSTRSADLRMDRSELRSDLRRDRFHFILMMFRMDQFVRLPGWDEQRDDGGDCDGGQS